MLLGFRSQNAYGGPTLIIVSNETSISLLHGVFFSLGESATYWLFLAIVVVGSGVSGYLHSPNLNLKTRCGVQLLGSFGSCLAHTRRP